MGHYSYWGKSNKQTKEYHLLPYHCLDVASVAYTWIKLDSKIATFFQNTFQIESTSLLKLIPFLAAIHDIGKFSDSFQNLNTEIAQKLGRTTTYPYSSGERHDWLGYLLWNTIQNQFFQSELGNMDDLFPAIFGHHGKPVSLGEGFYQKFSTHNIQDATTFVSSLWTIFSPENALNSKFNKSFTWWFAGFISICDWLGSDTSCFRYYAATISLEEYWTEISLPNAKKALQNSGILPIRVSGSKSFSNLFPEIQATQTPLQQAIENLDILDEPQLFILEDVTGAGKTEAALMLAHRLIAKGLGEGVFIGLPTMATSDAMYERVQPVYHQFFEGNSLPSLVLAHGARELNDTFLSTISEESIFESELSTRAYCTYWLSNNRKKSLLAPFGVGTIDQALLSILQTKYQSLRLWGLRRKVLILDEVHASDSYMHALTCSLLKFHREAGGSAILLSATLPQKMKQQFIRAFDGVEPHKRKQIPGIDDHSFSDEYPLITYFAKSVSSPTEIPIQTRDSVKRTLNWSLHPDQNILIEKVLEKLHAGYCAAWICNTVTDATRLYQKMCEDYDPEQITLFHARFAMGDRLEIQNRVVNAFGKKGSPQHRTGKLVIATQVIEQSLDLDFDWMVTDLCPIDLLIQRAGRLRRHCRDQEGKLHTTDLRGEPELWVYSPLPEWDCKKNWYSKPFKSASHVYEDHSQVWKTARFVQDYPSFKIPENLREAIETVFEDDPEAIPQTLQPSSDFAQGEKRSQSQIASMNSITLESGYYAGYAWEEDIYAPTRLANHPTLTIRLAKWENGQLSPWFVHANSNKAWALSEVSVSRSKISGEAPPESDKLATAIQDLKSQWPGKAEFYTVIPLWENTEGNWVGRAIRKENDKIETIQIRYCEKKGVMW